MTENSKTKSLPAIVAHNVWKSYGEPLVLKGLDLILPQEKTLVILGRSGVGKSVLLRQIVGIEKPDLGYIEVAGTRITDLNKADLYQLMSNFGMLFQSSALFDSMSV